MFSPFVLRFECRQEKTLLFSCRCPSSISLKAQLHLCLTRQAEHKVLQVFCLKSPSQQEAISKNILSGQHKKRTAKSSGFIATPKASFIFFFFQDLSSLFVFNIVSLVRERHCSQLVMQIM